MPLEPSSLGGGCAAGFGARSFESRLVAHEQALLGRIRCMLGPELRGAIESSDVLQGVYLETLAAMRSQAMENEALLPWMIRVAQHRIVDEARRYRARSEVPFPAVADVQDACASQGSRLAADEVSEGLSRAVLGLGADRQRVLELRCLMGWNWRSIASELHRSEEAARKLYHRALVELGRSLAPLDDSVGSAVGSHERP